MKDYLKLLIKPLTIVGSVMIFCALLAKVVLSGDTLQDYADKNPEIAYASPEPDLLSSESEESEESEDEPISEDEAPATEEEIEDEDEITSVILLASKWSVAEDIIEVMPGFTKEPIGDLLFEYMKGISYPVTVEEAITILESAESDGEFLDSLDFDDITIEEIKEILPNVVLKASDIAVSREELSFLTILHYDFEGNEQAGEMICNAAIADELLEIFYTLYLNEYRLDSVRLIDEYGGSDRLSMIDNNSSCFNYRESSAGRLSRHAYGMAVDINPFYNPYVLYHANGEIKKISPEGSDFYADRSIVFPYKIDENDLCYRLFKEYGFTWGGDWNFEKDYHHFQKTLR